MVTWADAYARGAREAEGGVVVPDGPAGDALERELVAEVRSRVPRFADGCKRSDLAPRFGGCDCCLEPLPPHRGGMCPLCAAASRKALELRLAAPERRAA